MNKHILLTRPTARPALFADRVSSSPPSPVLTGEGAGGEGLPSPLARSYERYSSLSPLAHSYGRGAGGEGLLASQLSSTIVRPIATHEERQV